MRKLKRYMVGFDADNQTVYGKDEKGRTCYADPMTLGQAQRYVKKLEGRTAKAIYKLVPVRGKKA